MAGLLKNFKVKKKSQEECLPDPEGRLNKHLSSEAIRDTNNEVRLVVVKGSGKLSPYLNATSEQKADEDGVINSIQRFLWMTNSKKVQEKCLPL